MFHDGTVPESNETMPRRPMATQRAHRRTSGKRERESGEKEKDGERTEAPAKAGQREGEGEGPRACMRGWPTGRQIRPPIARPQIPQSTSPHNPPLAVALHCTSPASRTARVSALRPFSFSKRSRPPSSLLFEIVSHEDPFPVVRPPQLLRRQ